MNTECPVKAETLGLPFVADRAARDYGWRVTNRAVDIVRLRVPGEWSDYDLTLTHQPDLSTIEVRCVFALAPPRERWVEVGKLAKSLNRSFHRGMLELRIDEDHGTYTDWVPMEETLPDGPSIYETMRSAVGTCDMLLFPAFHCVAWAEINAETALDRVSFGMLDHRIH